MNKNDLPLGFSFALAQNPEAMKFFSNLSDAKQLEFLQWVQGVSSKEEMQHLVNSLTNQ